MSDVAAAYAHCERIARREARNFYYGFLPLDRPRRDGIHAAYAFSRRCDDSVDGDEPLEWKLAQLAARRREVRACASGHPDAADPVLVALADAMARFGIPEREFDRIVDGVEMDLTTSRYATFEDLKRYCDRVAGAVGVVSLHIFGFTDPRAPALAEDLGVALQIVNIMRDVAEDAARDRVYVPQDDLARFGVPANDLAAASATTALRAALAAQGARAHHFFGRLDEFLALLDRRSRMCVATLSGLYRAILREIEARDHDVLAQRVALSATRKLRVLAGGVGRGLARR